MNIGAEVAVSRFLTSGVWQTLSPAQNRMHSNEVTVSSVSGIYLVHSGLQTLLQKHVAAL